MVVRQQANKLKKFRRTRNLLLSQSDPPNSYMGKPNAELKKSVAHLLAVAPNVAAIVYLLLRPPRKLTGLKRKKTKKPTFDFYNCMFLK